MKEKIIQKLSHNHNGCTNIISLILYRDT